MDRLPDLICPKHMIPPTNQQLTHSPIPHTGQIRNLSVIINILHLLVSKIWTLRLKFQNVTKIGGFNPYYFTTELLQLLCNWSPYFLSIPLQFILNVFPGKKKNRITVSLRENFSLPIFHRIMFILSLPLKAFLNQTPAYLVSHSCSLIALFFGDFNLKTE